VKADKGQIARAVRSPPADIRLFLLYGPDEAGSRSLGKQVATGMGADTERIDLSGSDLKSDPARLPDEAASISLFGGARYVWVEPAGDEAAAAVEALLAAPAAGNPVVLIAGALKPTSRLLKLALGSPTAIAFASYPPEGGEADKLIVEMARAGGLLIRPDLARRIADAATGNRAIAAQEIEKLALLVDAAPERPREVDHEHLDRIGAAADEGDLGRLVDCVAGGDPAGLEAELLRLSSYGVEGIVLIRAVLRRMLLLAKLRAAVDRGSSADSVMASQGKSLFWKEKPAISRQLGRWRSDLLARALGRLLEAEREVKASGGLGPLAVEEELLAISRQAARLR